MTLNPVADEDLYESLLLGGHPSPGSVTFSGHDRKFNWDVKAGSGQKGATTTLKDVPPIEFSATFYLVSEQDFDNWDEFATVVTSTVSGPKPKALDIYHPDLIANDITSVCLANFGGPIHDGKGGMRITIKFQEYKPPKPKGGSPSGSKPKKPAATDPDAAAKAELARLTAQYQATPWG